MCSPNTCLVDFLPSAPPHMSRSVLISISPAYQELEKLAFSHPQHPTPRLLAVPSLKTCLLVPARKLASIPQPQGSHVDTRPLLFFSFASASSLNYSLSVFFIDDSYTMSFKQVKFTQYKIKHFEVHRSVALSVFIVLSSHHLYLLPKHFHHLQRKSQARHGGSHL
jgi:hypothetical protein